MSDFVTIKFKLITDGGLVFYPQTVKIDTITSTAMSLSDQQASG